MLAVGREGGVKLLQAPLRGLLDQIHVDAQPLVLSLERIDLGRVPLDHRVVLVGRLRPLAVHALHQLVKLSLDRGAEVPALVQLALQGRALRLEHVDLARGIAQVRRQAGVGGGQVSVALALALDRLLQLANAVALLLQRGQQGAVLVACM